MISRVVNRREPFPRRLNCTLTMLEGHTRSRELAPRYSCHCILSSEQIIVIAPIDTCDVPKRRCLSPMQRRHEKVQINVNIIHHYCRLRRVITMTTALAASPPGNSTKLEKICRLHTLFVRLPEQFACHFVVESQRSCHIPVGSLADRQSSRVSLFFLIPLMTASRSASIE